MMAEHTHIHTHEQESVAPVAISLATIDVTSVRHVIVCMCVHTCVPLTIVPPDDHHTIPAVYVCVCLCVYVCLCVCVCL